MARKSNIQTAFSKNIKLASTGKRSVKTVDFVEQLASYGHAWSFSEANYLDRLLPANVARHHYTGRG